MRTTFTKDAELFWRLYANIKLIDRGKQVISAKNLGGMAVLNAGFSIGMPYLIA
jgi:uncharacterized protein YneR